MCDHLKYLLTVAGLRWEAEIYVNAQRSLRADLVVHSFVDGKPLALDVQVVHGLSSRLGEEAVAKGENDKKAKYSAACSMIDMNFSPVVWDTLGGLGSDSLKFMQKLITAAAPNPLILQTIFGSARPWLWLGPWLASCHFQCLNLFTSKEHFSLKDCNPCGGW